MKCYYIVKAVINLKLPKEALNILLSISMQKEIRYAELYRSSNAKSPTLKKWLRALREYHLVARLKRGYYTITETGQIVCTYLSDTGLEFENVAKASSSRLKRALTSSLALLGPNASLVSVQRALIDSGVIGRHSMTPLYNALNELVDMGFIKKIGRGKYSLSDEGSMLFEYQTLVWSPSTYSYANPLKRFLDSTAYQIANGFWCIHGFLDFEFALPQNVLTLYRKFWARFVKEFEKIGFVYRVSLGSVDLFKLIEPNIFIHIVLSPPVNFIIHAGIPSVNENVLLEGGKLLRTLVDEETKKTCGVPRYLRSAKACGFDLSPNGVGPYSWAFSLANSIEPNGADFSLRKLAVRVGIDSLLVGVHNITLDLLRNISKQVLSELGYRADRYKENMNSFTSLWEARSFFETRRFSDLEEYRALLFKKHGA
jgi:predicted transcriptional regulator